MKHWRKLGLVVGTLSLGFPIPAVFAENAYRAELVTDGLSYPWDLTSSGDQLIITEVDGSIVVIRDGKLRRYPLQTSDPVVHDGGSGLLGIALARDFATSGSAFVYHTYRSDGRLLNKVVEVRFSGEVWREERTLLAAIPGHRLYNGGRISLGPDDNLYVPTGWTEDRMLPQDLSSLAGKILRMKTDGGIPADNPFTGSYVYSLGHRNPQGLAWDAKGRMFVAEHGQSAHDEINLIEAGANYGWPDVQGDQVKPGTRPPLLHSGATTWAPSGATFSDKKLLVTALGGKSLMAFDPATRAMNEVFSSDERYRDVERVGSTLFVITTNRSPRASGPSHDRLLRLISLQ